MFIKPLLSPVDGRRPPAGDHRRGGSRRRRAEGERGAGHRVHQGRRVRAEARPGRVRRRETGHFPAVLVIHGGAWRGGNKADVGRVLHEFAARGYVAVSPQYRFCPKEVFPAQVHDVKAAVRWLKANAKERKVDPERIGAIGFSAGGHLALMLGVTGPADGLEGEVSAGAPDSRVKAVVNYFGPTDLAAKRHPRGLQAAGQGLPGRDADR